VSVDISMKDKYVLVVEDYELNQELLQLQILEMGFKLLIANNGYEAVEHCKNEDIGLILMDINMPVMNGYEAAKKIRGLKGKYENVPIIAMSANVDREIQGNCHSSGINDIVVKPVGKKMLGEIFEKLFSGENQADGINAKDTLYLNGEPGSRDPQDKGIYLDYEKAKSEFCGNVVLLNNSIKSFLLNVDSKIALVKKAILDKDLEFVRLQMHKISGAAANLTAVPLSKLAGALENMAASNEASYDDLNNSLEEFENYYYDFKKHIEIIKKKQG